jgi:hypothetical protein
MIIILLHNKYIKRILELFLRIEQKSNLFYFINNHYH